MKKKLVGDVAEELQDNLVRELKRLSQEIFDVAEQPADWRPFVYKVPESIIDKLQLREDIYSRLTDKNKVRPDVLNSIRSPRSKTRFSNPSPGVVIYDPKRIILNIRRRFCSVGRVDAAVYLNSLNVLNQPDLPTEYRLYRRMDTVSIEAYCTNTKPRRIISDPSPIFLVSNDSVRVVIKRSSGDRGALSDFPISAEERIYYTRGKSQPFQWLGKTRT